MDNELELIVVLVNSGFSEVVMDAAREKGAHGGTVVNCRGTANKEIEKKYGIAISEDKDMLLIVVAKDIRDDILKAINDSAGLQTEKRGIIFSLPISDAVGLKFDK